jgi:putative ubiquitin-RnfH superfamily antitoxin RatB of RatAB toxin-antitoxin module
MPRVHIEVVYALAGAQDIVALELASGARAGEAVAASGLLQRHALAAEDWNLGLAGRRIPPDRLLRDGDRVELLRPLALDPKEARRARARKARRR